jgi:hypothetical protein
MHSLKAVRLYRNLVNLSYPFADKEELMPEDRFIQDSIQPFTINGEARLHLQEWLLNLYEPDILNDPDINLPSLNLLQKIALAYDQIGVPYDSYKDIQGICSYEPSIDILLNLSELVIFSRAENDSTSHMSSEESLNVLETSRRLINFVTDRRERVFTTEVKMFPPTFPMKSANIKHDMIGHLDKLIYSWKQDAEDLRNQISTINKKYIESKQYLPSNTLIQQLKTQISDFTITVKEFKRVYEETISHELVEKCGANQIGNIIQEPIGLGPVAEECYVKHKNVIELIHNLETVWEVIKQCSENGPVGKVKNVTLFDENCINELADQVKLLRQTFENRLNN